MIQKEFGANIKMNVLYLTYGETPVPTGVYQSQVLDLKESLESKYDINFKLISFLPIINSGFKRFGFKYKWILSKIKKDYGLIVKWVVAPQNFIFHSHFVFNAFHFNSGLNNYLKGKEIDVVHCRSYHAAYEALKCKELYGFKYKVIFDPRGHFPEEVCVKGYASFGGASYQFFKEVENYILSKADVIICLSDPMYEYFKNLSNREICKLVYASAKLPVVINENKLTNNTKTLCYVGALPDNGWHKASSLRLLYLAFKRVFKDSKLLIITQTPKSVILKHFEPELIDSIEFYAAKNTDDVYSKLITADFGALPFCTPSDDAESLVGKTMVGTKTLEYIAAGVPILANKLCLGASMLISKFDLGVVYDELNIDDDINSNLIDNALQIDCVKKGPHICNSEFSLEANSEKYYKIYKELINED